MGFIKSFTSGFITKAVLFAVSAVLSACENGPELPPDADFYPVYPGYSMEYRVTEHQYSITDPEPETKTWYLKEIIGDSIGSVAGFPLYSLQRFVRLSPAAAWQIDSVWTLYRQPDKIVRIENNTPYLLLTLPAIENRPWNRNVLNTLPPSPYSLSFTDPLTIRVAQAGDSSLIHYKKGHEIYRSGTGLVYRQVLDYQYCQTTPECIGKNIISSGYDITYECLACGHLTTTLPE